MTTVGRPPKYNSPEDFQVMVDLYFTKCDAEEKPYTVPGVAYFLGFESRQSLWDYGKVDGFSYTIKNLKMKIEEQRVTMGLQGTAHATITIFDLKNNFGYKDTINQEVNATVETRNITTLEDLENEMKKQGIPVPK